MTAAHTRGTVWHIRGTLLPQGEVRDLWLVDGIVSTTPVRDAQTVAEGWIVPGFVDAHCHIGLDAGGAVDEAEQERQAVTERDAGVLLARDCGVPSDTRWMDARDDLPRIIRAGRHIAAPRRYIRDYGVEVHPEALVETVVAQTERSDGWVKIVGDWIDRDIGDLGPCWPLDVLTAAVAAAHARGNRVTTHVFGEAALPEVLAAGVDCVEHGTGLSADLISDMAARQVALVPTLINIATFPTIAEQAAKFPGYAQHMLRLHEGVGAMVAAAYEAGVPIYAGTDAGGSLAHGRIADEIRALAAAGIPTEDAIGAASWRARGWLGRAPHLEEGAPADLVVFAADPRREPDVLAHPSRVILRGNVVR